MSSIVDFCKKKNFCCSNLFVWQVTCFDCLAFCLLSPFISAPFPFFFHEKENYEVLLKVSEDKVPRC